MNRRRDLAGLVMELVGDPFRLLLSGVEIPGRESAQCVAMSEHFPVERTVLPLALFQTSLDALAARDVADGAEDSWAAGSGGPPHDGRDRQGGLDRLASARLQPDLPLLDFAAPAGAQSRQARAEWPALPAADEDGQGPAHQIALRQAQEPRRGAVGVPDVAAKVGCKETVGRPIE